MQPLSLYLKCWISCLKLKIQAQWWCSVKRATNNVVYSCPYHRFAEKALQLREWMLAWFVCFSRQNLCRPNDRENDGTSIEWCMKKDIKQYVMRLISWPLSRSMPENVDYSIWFCRIYSRKLLSKKKSGEQTRFQEEWKGSICHVRYSAVGLRSMGM